MRTRKTETPKSVPAKKTAARKVPNKTPPKPSEASASPATPKSASSTGSKSVPMKATPKSALKLESTDGSTSIQPMGVKPEGEVKVAPVAKPTVKKTPGKPTKVASTQTPKSVGKLKPGVKESPKEGPFRTNADVSLKDLDIVAAPKVAESTQTKENDFPNVSDTSDVVEYRVKEEVEPVMIVEEHEVTVEETEEEFETVNDTKETELIDLDMEEDPEEDEESYGDELEKDDQIADEGMIDFGDQEAIEEEGDEDRAEDYAAEPNHGTKTLEIEQREISANANERKIRKEVEIFVGGLDRDAVEDDVKKVFEKVGEVVEVRLLKNPSTNKNKGFAFVRFAKKEQATKALSELKNPVIRGRRCGVAPSEDNDTLFVGNICNSWTREAIKRKMKDYGVEGVQNVNLVPDAQHDGLSRGFAFVEFSCHAEAMIAYKRLQKPDVVFGHTERTVKVAFAEPLREPDPEIMAQVKSVFVDGLPPHWDEEHVRQHFKGYGEIDRIVLARNTPTAKRKDFGFVDFTTHEAAIACIDGVNNTELGDGKYKTRIKARLSNPLPKTQTVKGGLCGGFRIGHAGGRTFSRSAGRGSGRAGRSFNRVDFHRSRGSYGRERDWAGRSAFADNEDFESPYYESRGRRDGRRRSVEDFESRAGNSSRTGLDWPRRAAPERSQREFQSRRQRFSPEEHSTETYRGRHFVDDPYLYTDRPHGIKRPFHVTDREPDYLEPSRLRRRYDYPDSYVSSSSARYQDSYGARSGSYSRDYYGSDYGDRAYSPTYGSRSDRSYGHGDGYYY